VASGAKAVKRTASNRSEVQRLLLLRRKKAEGAETVQKKAAATGSCSTCAENGFSRTGKEYGIRPTEMICALVAKEYTRREAKKP